MKKTISYFLIASMLLLSLPARADMVGTDHLLAQDARGSALATVETFLAREQVSTQLEAWGVATAVVTERVASLSDSELQRLAASIDDQPAAGSAVGVLLVVLLVLLILELAGQINIFR